MPEAGTVIAGRVLEVYERWQDRDPERHNDDLAVAKTGLSPRWFWRLRTEDPDRLLPAGYVDDLLTGLGLTYEWAFIADVPPQEEPELVERHCRSCKSNVLATSVPTRTMPCIWCGRRTLRPKPRGWRQVGGSTGMQLMGEDVLLDARQLYDEGLSIRDTAKQVGHRTNYRNLFTVERALADEFRRRGWPQRPRQAGPRAFKVGENWRNASEELLEEAGVLYGAGFSMPQVVAFLWDHLSYRTPATALSVFYRAFHNRGWPIRSKSEVTTGRNLKHGRYVAWREAKEPGHPQHAEYLAFMRDVYRERYYRNRRKCKHEGCSFFAGGKRSGVSGKQPKGHPDYCKRHDPEAAARMSAGMATRAARHEVRLAEVRPLLDAWAARPGGMRVLSAKSGINRGTVTRWAYRWGDEKLIKRELAEKLHTVGLPV